MHCIKGVNLKNKAARGSDITFIRTEAVFLALDFLLSNLYQS